MAARKTIKKPICIESATDIALNYLVRIIESDTGHYSGLNFDEPTYKTAECIEAAKIILQFNSKMHEKRTETPVK